MFLWLLACQGDPGNTDSGGTDPGDSSADTVPPEWCLEAEEGVLQDAPDHPAGPYFLSHPREPGDTTPTVLFLAGGSGGRNSAQYTFELFFMLGSGIGDVRVVLPYATSGSLGDDPERILDIVDEVLACYGGNRDAVHLAGTSNGGLAAFDLTLDHPEPFASLMGVPGVFSSGSATQNLGALANLRVYNGVGELDTNWKSEVQRIHEAMVNDGIDATYAEFADQGHVPTPDWDESVLFDFWLADRK